MVAGIAETFHLDLKHKAGRGNTRKGRSLLKLQSPPQWPRSSHEEDSCCSRIKMRTEAKMLPRLSRCSHTEAVQRPHCDGWNWWVALPSLWVKVPQVVVAVLLFALVDTQVCWVLNTQGISYATTHACDPCTWDLEEGGSEIQSRSWLHRSQV